MLGAGIIKYFENIFSAFNNNVLADMFSFLPDAVVELVVPVVGLFVGSGWHLTLGILFVVIVVFLPGGVIEGINRLAGLFKKNEPQMGGTIKPQDQPGE